MKRGYLNSSMKQVLDDVQLNAFISGCDELQINNELSYKKFLANLTKGLKPGDKIILYDFESLNMTLAQYGNFSQVIAELKVTLDFKNVSKKDLSLIVKLTNHEQRLMKYRMLNGMEVARKDGRTGGRPSISNEIQQEIKYLYINQKKSLRQIAEQLEVSVGTCHKYIHNTPFK